MVKNYMIGKMLKDNKELYSIFKGKRAEYNGANGIIVGYCSQHLIMLVNKSSSKKGNSKGRMIEEDRYCSIKRKDNGMGYLFVDEEDIIMSYASKTENNN